MKWSGIKTIDNVGHKTIQVEYLTYIYKYLEARFQI